MKITETIMGYFWVMLAMPIAIFFISVLYITCLLRGEKLSDVLKEGDSK